MKVGSLVGALLDIVGMHSVLGKVGKSIKKDTVLTVRLITDRKILFEEIVNPLNPNSGNEFAYKTEWFAELQPPISNIEEHIKENTLEPELS